LFSVDDPNWKLDLLTFFLLTGEVCNSSQWIKRISKRLKLELSKLERVNSFVLLNSLRPRMLQEAPHLPLAFIAIYRGFQEDNCPLKSLHNRDLRLITWRESGYLLTQ